MLNLARVALGRALLDRGQYAAAAAAVASVPDDFQYQETMFMGGDENHINPRNLIDIGGTASDREGGNGLPYSSSGDPRTTDTVVSTAQEGIRLSDCVSPPSTARGLTGGYTRSYCGQWC